MQVGGKDGYVWTDICMDCRRRENTHPLSDVRLSWRFIVQTNMQRLLKPKHICVLIGKTINCVLLSLLSCYFSLFPINNNNNNIKFISVMPGCRIPITPISIYSLTRSQIYPINRMIIMYTTVCAHIIRQIYLINYLLCGDSFPLICIYRSCWSTKPHKPWTNTNRFSNERTRSMTFAVSQITHVSKQMRFRLVRTLRICKSIRTPERLNMCFVSVETCLQQIESSE